MHMFDVLFTFSRNVQMITSERVDMWMSNGWSVCVVVCVGFTYCMIGNVSTHLQITNSNTYSESCNDKSSHRHM